jgi:hypothetical protein
MSMIAAARVWVLAVAAGAALLIAGAAMEPAAAQDDCKADLVTSTGRGKFRPFTKTKELEGNGAAMKDAVATWEREVGATHGERWKQWELAKDKTRECGITQGKILSGLVACTISGRPCAAPEPPAAPPVTAGSPGTSDQVRRADRDDNVRVGPVGGRSWRYRQEMRRQQLLAQWRERREERAFEHEQARQRYLERSRDRREDWGWKRIDARERWLARQRD